MLLSQNEQFGLFLALNSRTITSVEWSRHRSIRDSIRYGRYVSLCMKAGSLWAVFNTLLLDFTLEVIMYVYVFAGTYLNSICFYYDHMLYSLLVPTRVRCQEDSHRVVLYRWITWLIGKQQSGDEPSASNVNIVLMSDHTCFNTECTLEADPVGVSWKRTACQSGSTHHRGTYIQ